MGAVVKEKILKIGLIIKTKGPAVASPNETFSILKEEVRIIHIEADEISGVETIPITGTGIIEIEIPITKVILIGAEDGIITEVKDIVIEGEGEDGTQISNIMIPGTNNTHNLKTPNHYHPPPMGQQYHYPIPYEQYPYPQQQQQYPPQQTQAPSRQATNICQLCQNQGHYDYQCQFAGDFMARMQKAFNQGCSYNHQDQSQGEWSNGDNDNNDPNGQPFQ